nr:DUF5686 family protein [uncultured Capnocytophaga sp.]
MRKIFLLFLFSAFYLVQLSAQTHVSGKVIDENGLPIAYANVLFSKTTIGAYTDEEGRFSLYSEKRQRDLEVSFIGYTTKKVHLDKDNTKGLVVVLVEGEQLSEVTIVAKPTKALSKKENPAYTVLQGIWKNKKKRGLQNAIAYQYKKHSTTELGVNNLDTLFLKKALGQEYDTIRRILSEKKYKETFSLPMYLTEKIEKVYADNQLHKKRVDIEAERSQGIVQQGFGLERVSRSFDDFDVYDNTYMILNKPFVSPLAEFGYGVYLYVLSDTIQDGYRSYYRINFFPRDDQDLALEGNFEVDTKTFIVKSIQMHTTPKTNINLVRGLSFEKYFTIANDSIYLPEREIQEGDFTLLTKKDEEKGLYIKNYITFSDIVLNKPKSPDFYDLQVVKTAKDQFYKDDTYWNTHTLGGTDLTKTKRLIHQVGDNRRIKMIGDLTDIVTSGYIPIGNYMQFGRFWQTFSSNNVEGLRLRAGFRSFFSTDDRFRVYAYGAYGLKDKQFKYGVSGKYLISYSPRIIIGTGFQDDNLQLGTFVMHDDTELNFEKTTNFIIARGENYYLTRNKKLQGVINYDLANNVRFSVFGTYQNLASASETDFLIAYRNPKTGELLHQYDNFYTGGELTFTPGRKVFGYGVEQRYGKKLFSTYTLKYSKGVEGIGHSNFDYDKLQLLACKPIPLFGYGILHAAVEAGKVLGTAPLIALAPTPANQSYSSAPQTFALLDYYDFITDSYINGYFEHHFDGFLFNRIPFVQKTRFKSLLFARFAYGTLSEKNKRANLTNIVFNSPEKLYWEYGFGIENIGLGNFRFIRVDFVWRNDFNDVNGVRNPKFGIRLGIVPSF